MTSQADRLGATAERLRDAVAQPRLYRDPDDRLVAGVCAGVARQIGVDPLVVRVGTVAFAFAGGVGIVLYLLGWTIASDAPPDGTPPPPITRRQTIAVGFVTLGFLLLLRDVGLWLGDRLVLPVLLAAVGSAVIWARADDDDRDRWGTVPSRFPGAAAVTRSTPLRIALGLVLIALGMTAILATTNALLALRSVGLALAAATAGALLVFGPWVARLVREVADERRERIRSEERAEVAAHLHDSVLQTLALLQRSADQPRRMVALARSQERELRAWLYDRRDVDDEGLTLRGLLDAMLVDVEAAHELDVDLVVVGDLVLDHESLRDDVRSLVGAVREALTNVGKHAGVATASVYVEVEEGACSAFVRDRGDGFDPAAVGDDRRGLAESIRGRLQRHGGHATLSTVVGDGTEWELTLPLRREPPRAEEPVTQPDWPVDQPPTEAAT